MTHIASSSPEKYVPTCCTYIGYESFDEHLFRKENEAEILSFSKQTNLFSHCSVPNVRDMTMSPHMYTVQRINAVVQYHEDLFSWKKYNNYTHMSTLRNTDAKVFLNAVVMMMMMMITFYWIFGTR
jgi:hypothetical protein